MRNNAWVAAMSLLVAAVAMPAMADEMQTVGDLSRVQSETILLKAKVDRATAQAQLDAKTHTGSSINDDVDVPVVKAVYGVNHKLYATFLFANGVSEDAKIGDEITGGFRVSMLTVDKVVLIKGHRHFNVGFSAVAPVATQAVTSPQGSPTMPMPLPGASR